MSRQFPRALVEVGTDLSFAVAYADAVAVTVQLGLPWCVKVADIIFDVCRVLRGFVTLSVTDVIGSSVPPPVCS